MNVKYKKCEQIITKTKSRLKNNQRLQINRRKNSSAIEYLRLKRMNSLSTKEK